MDEYQAAEKRLRQRREQRITAYLTYISVAVIVIIVVFVGYILSSSVFKPKIPQSPTEREYAQMKELLKKDPKRIDWLMRISQAEIELGKTGDAIDHMKLAIRIQRYAPMLHYVLGQAYMVSGNTTEAIKAFNQEMKVTEDRNELAAYDLGRIYFEQKNYDKALSYFQISAKRMPAMADVHYYLGMTYEAKKDYEQATTEYKEVLQFVPDHKEAAEALLRITGTAVGTTQSLPSGGTPVQKPEQ